MERQSIPTGHDFSGDGQVQPLVESLLGVLRTEIDLQKELHSSLEEERQVLKHPDANQLLQSNAKKEGILLKAMMLDEVIAGIVKQISRTASSEAPQLTLSDLAAYVTPPLQTELQNCRTLLASLVMNNRELNDSNRDLLAMLLRLVNNSMRIITNLMSADSDYVGSGQRNAPRMTGAVLCTRG